MTITALGISAKNVVEIINRRDWSQMAARCYYNLDLEIVATGEVFVNVQEFIDFWKSWTTIFPDLSVSLVNTVTSSSTEVMELCFKGTQTGPFPVADGTIPPTGLEVVWRACFIYDLEIEDMQKIKGVRVYYDIVTLLDQLATSPFPNVEQDKEAKT